MNKLIKSFPPIALILWLMGRRKWRREYRELKESIKSITLNQVDLDPEIRTLINKNFHKLLDNEPQSILEPSPLDWPDTITIPAPIKPYPAKYKPKSKPPKGTRNFRVPAKSKRVKPYVGADPILIDPVKAFVVSKKDVKKIMKANPSRWTNVDKLMELRVDKPLKRKSKPPKTGAEKITALIRSTSIDPIKPFIETEQTREPFKTKPPFEKPKERKDINA